MRIVQTRVRGFRSLENALCEWHPGVNLLCGPNGAGKTNMLEALHVLTGWGPFSGKLRDTVRWGGDRAKIAASVDGERTATIEADIVARASLRLDGAACRWGDLRGCVQSLAFLPSDMALIEGSPAVRRRFLDVLCALVFPAYAYGLSEYRRVVMHRRSLLARGHSPGVTQETMASLAAWIWERRGEALAALAGNIGRWSVLRPRPLELTLKRGGAGNADDAREDFDISCEMSAARERAAATPLVGPHRDDLIVSCEGRLAAEALSRGQRRRSALALVMAAASALEDRFRQAPVLLLDEVTSELDADGRAALSHCLTKSGWQVFAATAEPTMTAFDGQIWRLDAGKIAPFERNKAY